MSKKDYQAIARAVYRLHVDYDAKRGDGTYLWDEGAVAHGAKRMHKMIIAALADVLAADNPRFDRSRFLEACETGRCKGMR